MQICVLHVLWEPSIPTPLSCKLHLTIIVIAVVSCVQSFAHALLPVYLIHFIEHISVAC